LKISRKDYFSVLFSGLFFGIHLFTYFYAIHISSIGIGVISLFTFPLMTTLLEPFVLKLKPKKKDLMLGFLILVGVFLIVSDTDLKGRSFEGVVFGIVSAISYSIRNLIQKYRLSDYRPDSMLFYQMLITFILMLPFSTTDFTQMSLVNYELLIVLSVVFTIIPHLAVIESLKMFDARSVSLILTLQVFYAIIIAYFVINEDFKLSVVVGGSLVFFTVSYESLRIQYQLKKKPTFLMILS